MERAHKKIKGRAFKRMLFNRRYANLVVSKTGGRQKKKSPNWNAGRKEVPK